ncbi:hypothetical protein BH10ACI2_BH10ACI2_16850 [soil metagenome]
MVQLQKIFAVSNQLKAKTDMKRPIHVRVFVSFFLVMSMLSPITAFAFGDGKKHFKEGMKFEDAQTWDKAVEEFALAVSDDPKNPEFRLHLARSLFNASQMFMNKGNTAAKEKDYEGAYVSFRRAYAFDPTNELAKSEMDRMVRLQQELNESSGDDKGKKDLKGGVKMVTTGFTPQTQTPPSQVQQKLEKLRDIPFPGGVDLPFIIKELAKDLDLNVLFDTESFRSGGPARKTNIELKNVSAAQALDYIFLQEGLFFQKVGPRTILVANQAQRVKFQQLVLRTFYLSNAAPKDVLKVVQTAIPAQPGRSQTIVLTDDATNSVTVRDTEENIRLIGRLISSLDKDRAEVVMDVAIYEVNKSDLMQFGNQLGSSAAGGSLANIGGFGFPIVHAGSTNPITSKLPFSGTDVLSAAIGLPVSSISALQRKSDTKLVASTQIHAFNNEDSSARIGQRVPVKSASFQTGVSGGVISGGGSIASDVINYEQVGLTLKFKPIVFPNQDVQVAMEIESKDVAGAQTLTPTFTERTIKGTARIQNNKTLLLASVAQGVETKGREGLPLLGMIPILGRLFSAPTRDNRQVDIVIAVTPRVIRAPAILPEDEVERSTGSLAVPTNSNLEAMLFEDERLENLAIAKRMAAAEAASQTAVSVQLPDRTPDSPQYVKADTNAAVQAATTQTADVQPAATQTASVQPAVNQPSTAKPLETATVKTDTTVPEIKPIDNSVRTLQLNQTSLTAKPKDDNDENEDVQPAAKEPVKEPAAETATAGPSVELQLGQQSEMKAGEKIKIPVMIQGDGTFGSAVVGFRYDEKKLAIRTVSFGDAFGLSANTAATPFLNRDGKMFVSFQSKDGGALKTAGTLAFIEVEALTAGRPEIWFVSDIVNVQTTDGKNFAVKLKD